MMPKIYLITFFFVQSLSTVSLACKFFSMQWTLCFLFCLHIPLLYAHCVLLTTLFSFFSLEDYYVMLMKNAQIPAPPTHPAVSQVKGSSLDSTLSNSLSFDSILSGTGSPGKVLYLPTYYPPPYLYEWSLNSCSLFFPPFPIDNVCWYIESGKIIFCMQRKHTAALFNL